MRKFTGNTCLIIFCGFLGVNGLAQDKGKYPGYLDTPVITGQKWRVHDANRPQPPVIDPGTASTQEKAGTAPSDAIVIFDGTSLDQFENKKWKISDGAMVVGRGSQKTIKKI